ncbi:MAG: hypothetical protein V1916_00910 [Patescibacteria group bacterium]
MATPTLTPEDRAILIRRFRLQMWLGLGTIMFIGLLVASFLVFRQPAQAPTVNGNQNSTIASVNTTTPSVGAVVKKFYPNFYNIFQEVPDGDTVWLATEGGVLGYHQSTNTFTEYTEAQGLPGHIINSAVRQTGTPYLWVGTNRGVARIDVDTGTVAKYQRASELEDEQSVFDHSYPTLYGGLVSNANIQLRLDPYTGTLWAGTFRGVSWYDPAVDQWSSYGAGDGINFSGVNDVAFDRENVWIFVTRDAETVGGIIRLSKSTKVWEAYDETALPVGRHALLIAAGDGGVWVTGRPSDWKSFAASRENIVYQYRPADDTWTRVTALENVVGQQEKIVAMEYVAGKLQLRVRSLASSASGKPDRQVLYDPSTATVSTGILPQTFMEQYGSNLPFPKSKSVQYVTADGILALVPFTYFNAATLQFVNQPGARVAGYSANGVDGSMLVPLPCNRWGASTDDVYFESRNEGMGGMTIALHVYRAQEQQVVELLDDQQWQQLPVYEPDRCSAGVLWKMTDRGMVGYTVASKVEKVYTDGLQPVKQVLMSDSSKAYFWTTVGTLGSFDYVTLQYSYTDVPALPLADRAGKQLPLTDLVVTATLPDEILFTGTDAVPHAVYRYRISTRAWTSATLPSSIDAVRQVVVVNGDTWVTTDKQVFRQTGSAGEFTEVTAADGMMTTQYVSLFPVGKSLWFSSGAGMWGWVVQ